MARSITRGLWASAALAAGAVAGCGDLNQSSRLGGTVGFEALGDGQPRVDAAPAPGQSDAPSVTSLDRNGWQERSFVVPMDGAAHHPTYTSGLGPRYTRDLARQRGEYPTAETALDTWSPAARGAMIAEAAAASFWAGLDIVAAPCRMVRFAPWSITAEPRAMPARAPTPAGETAGAGGVRP